MNLIFVSKALFPTNQTIVHSHFYSPKDFGMLHGQKTCSIAVPVIVRYHFTDRHLAVG